MKALVLAMCLVGLVGWAGDTGHVGDSAPGGSRSEPAVPVGEAAGISSVYGGDGTGGLEDRSQTYANLGPVFLYGVRIEKPYRFTLSDDGRRLYLNGYFYGGDDDTLPPPMNISEGARARHSLRLEAAHAMEAGRTFQESLAIYADVLRSSPLVKGVRVSGEFMYVTWEYWPDDEVEVKLSRESAHYDLADALEGLKSDFWRVVEAGGMITFGKDGCRMSIRPQRVPKTLEQIELIRQGVPREQLDIEGTPLRWDDFYYDITHPIERKKEE